MASTKLIRKAQKNRSRAKLKNATIKRLLAQPVIKKVDVEELKAQFGGAKAKKAAPKKAKAEEVKAEVEVKEAAPAAEAKEKAPKAEKAAPAKEAKAAPAEEAEKEA